MHKQIAILAVIAAILLPGLFIVAEGQQAQLGRPSAVCAPNEPQRVQSNRHLIHIADGCSVIRFPNIKQAALQATQDTPVTPVATPDDDQATPEALATPAATDANLPAPSAVPATPTVTPTDIAAASIQSSSIMATPIWIKGTTLVPLTPMM